jgi:hypothetical protein
MPSIRYTKIEITRDAYRSLEAEAILQEKTLKKLASELILQGVSKKALDFVLESENRASPVFALDEETTKVVKKIGVTDIHFSESTLQMVKKAILEDGYEGAMLHIAQHTTSMERDELHRVLDICRRYELSLKVAADIVQNLNEIESGIWK